jgi:hypothetical protein
MTIPIRDVLASGYHVAPWPEALTGTSRLLCAPERVSKRESGATTKMERYR